MSEQLEREVVLTSHQSPSGKISIITLNRESKYNALSGLHYIRLSNMMRQVSDDAETIATILIGTGKFFSAGADVNAAGSMPPSDGDVREFYLGKFAIGNLDITRQFFYHRHPLFFCLNGPVIGLSAAIVAFADFVYATPDTYLLTPFASLGLAPEGGASLMFPLKMGYALANRALMAGEALSCQELQAAQFISKVFPKSGFADATLKHIVSLLEDKNVESMHIAKAFLQDTLRNQLEQMNVKEIVAATDRFTTGIPQAQFMRLATKDKKHKL
ncbi:ClpP/crotonase-like domain-containing protein [Protomyces lactucae-debilis]|uniref:ClpP/crotonase-like domain-containing protein n=1 Tax=Protomyces lactucae-debilis TaxID=2754530 RepID=A0A1Y2EUY0_PROLT|nr:ClpP/crotonase-like domain-containing protein [Protomyces lactucae-debilis]ORY75074.1 ClpP/crotonase-like domain-containing protein [Protomyces lactucae-debilis]